jgi:hypothetical protein
LRCSPASPRERLGVGSIVVFALNSSPGDCLWLLLVCASQTMPIAMLPTLMGLYGSECVVCASSAKNNNSISGDKTKCSQWRKYGEFLPFSLLCVRRKHKNDVSRKVSGLVFVQHRHTFIYSFCTLSYKVFLELILVKRCGSRV